jgi:surface polysaccharide O-acyltransferase-like enzyme
MWFCSTRVFMVNGYLLLGKKSLDLKYSVKKILNILKIVALWSFVITVGKLLFSKTENNLLEAVWGFALQFVKSLVQKGTLWHFWFFGALMIIYCFIPLLFKLINKHFKIYKLLIVILIMVCVAVQLISIGVGKPVQSYVIQTFRLWTWFMYFGLGGVSANLMRR